tara:strand:- start:662 stop:2971 length:2310 start_codon:yes stop_codon:yes gene_type:complete
MRGLLRKNISKSRIQKLKVVVIGSGAREHALAEKLVEDKSITKVYVLPGNDGMVSDKIEIKDIKDNNEILSFCKKSNIKLVVVGPEVPLVNGLVDLLNKNEINAFGPTKDNAKLEGSKIYSKEIMTKYNIPTAKYKVYDNSDKAKEDILSMSNLDIVIKYDGLASGKGVFLPETEDEALTIIDNIFEKKVFGNNSKIIIEKKLFGTECSLMGFCNGKEIFFMPQAQDYKKKKDGDFGPNTGGMGSIAPVNILTDEEIKNMNCLINNLVKDFNYKGILYVGLMKTKKGLNVLEFNCRFGDPEAQVLLNLLNTSLYNICINCISGDLLDIEWRNESCINVVLSHKCYPYDKSSSLLEIKNLDKLSNNIKKYYSSVEKKNGKLYTNGGRVMSLVYLDNSLTNCYNTIYKNIVIDYQNIFYRKDIGLKYINNYNKNENIKNKNKLNYKDSGVDIDKGNDFVDIIKEISGNNKIGGFSGVVNYNGIKIAATTDGVGTKIELARKLNKYDTIGIDLVAMCVNDLIVQGAKPILFLDYLAVGKLDLSKSSEIIKGILEGCNQAGCSLIGGETAEMPIVYDEDKFDLAGFSVGIIEGEDYPKQINSGDLIVGLSSSGVHSNGFSLIHKILEEANYDLEELLTPTKIYVNDIEEIKTNFKDYIKGFSHITGGGIIDNIKRLLDDDHNIKISYDWEIPNVFKWIYKNSEMSVDDMLRTYNCGIGMVVILDKNIFNDIDNEKLLNMINNNNLIPIGLITKNTKNSTSFINYEKIKNKLDS